MVSQPFQRTIPDDIKLSLFDVFCWRLIIWVMGLAIPFLAWLKPRRFIAGEIDVVQSVGGLSRTASQGLYLFFLVFTWILVLYSFGKCRVVREQNLSRDFYLLSVLLAVMPLISSILSGGSLYWGWLGTLMIYSATYLLPTPTLDWWIRELRMMLLLVFVYGSLFAAILCPTWALNQDYASESTIAIFPVRLFGTTNHANALAPIAIFCWILGRFPNCRFSGEFLHGIMMLLVLVLTQSKTNVIIVMLLLIYYSVRKIISSNLVKKCVAYSVIVMIILANIIYLLKYSTISYLIQNILYDPQIITLTGRLPIWGFAIEMWLESPLIGKGLDVWSSKSLLDYINLLGWAAPNAHNQLLQILSESGLIGLCVFMLWVRQYTKIVQVAPDDVRKRIWWLSALYILPGITEVVFQYNIGPGYTLITWIVFTMMMIVSKNQINDDNETEVLNNRDATIYAIKKNNSF